MRFSSVLRVIIRGPNGQPFWREVSDLRLPKGGKTKGDTAETSATVVLYVYYCMEVNVCCLTTLQLL
ncbi:unnamed protein product [Angiostrongylus costaricensis]|uniref:Ubiquitin-like domain-containing protein n=1 Tax=Angiostrongylus costaricensis TaxID=334426 RepID=A0A0R3Q1Y2_ANGCS|nr:unnamed protein product [Angiostrongylus costaricensis]